MSRSLSTVSRRQRESKAVTDVPSIEQIHAALCAPGEPFEMEFFDLLGILTLFWKRAPRTLGGVLAQGASPACDRVFIVLEGERLTHQEHFERVSQFAGALGSLGVQKGDRVAIAMRNLPEWSIAFFGSAMVGAIAVPLNAFGNGDELAFAIEDADASVVVADGERLERLATRPDALAGRTIVGTRIDDRKGHGDLPDAVLDFDSLLAGPQQVVDVDVLPDDPATIFYTSGTTSRPKGVLGTHRNICSSLVNLMFSGARAAQRSPAPSPAAEAPPVLLVAVPLFHATGCHSMLLSQAFFGGTLVFMRRWDPEVALDLIERERVTAFSGVPTMLWDVLRSPMLEQRDLGSLRTFGGGGAASPPELARRINDRFPAAESSTGYGLTETSSVTTAISGRDYVDRPDSVGVPVAVCDVRIAGPDGQDVARGERGEIWIKGPNVVPEYWRRPEDTAEAFVDGWLRSGDIGRVDEDGFLYIVDRAKDIVIRGGENISTLEVESALIEQPDVVEVAVFATPHPTLGEEVGAVVRIAVGSTLTADELRAHAAARLAPYKVPSQIWLRAEPFPRGDTGKILKRALQAEYAAAR